MKDEIEKIIHKAADCLADAELNIRFDRYRLHK